MRFSNKIALVTGGTSGIGLATAKILADEGATVIITGRKYREEINSVCNNEQKIAGKIIFYKCDVSNLEDIEGLYNFIIQKFNKLDILFNNAGALITGTLDEFTEDEWNYIYDVNVKAFMRISKKFIDILKNTQGVILNNASINGLHHYIKGKRSYMYATSKAASIQFANYLAKNYAPDVRVNTLCPGITETNLFTNRDFSRFSDNNLLGRMAKPEEIAKVAAFLLSEDSSFIVGATIIADGGENIK